MTVGGRIAWRGGTSAAWVCTPRRASAASGSAGKVSSTYTVTRTYLTPSAAVKCLPELDQAVQRRLPTALLGRAIEVYDQRAIPFFLKSPFAYFADSPFGIVSVFQPAPAKWRAR